MFLVDDLDEVEASEIANVGRFVFVSCWTEADEKYSMWDSEYADYKKGVRISLPRFPFVKYKIDETIMKDGGEPQINGNSFETYLPFKATNMNDHVAANFNETNFLVPIEYTVEKTLLKPTIVEMQELDKIIKIDLIGKHKSLYWGDQEEVRYRFNIAPFTYGEMREIKTPDEVPRLFNRYFDDSVHSPFDHFYLSIDGQTFNKMIITTGPKMLDADYLEVVDLIGKFNPMAQIRKSEVRVR